MRRKKEEFNSEIFILLREVKRYFGTVINCADFVIAVDVTGVYLFTSNTDKEQVLISASQVMTDLSLKREEFIICMIAGSAEVAERGFFDFGVDNTFEDSVIMINPSEFEDVIRRLTGSRKKVFGSEDIASIVDCFSEVVQSDVHPGSYLDDFNLEPGVIERLKSYLPLSAQDVMACGVPAESAQDVFRAIQAHNALKAPQRLNSSEYARPAELSFLSRSVYFSPLLALLNVSFVQLLYRGVFPFPVSILWTVGVCILGVFGLFAASQLKPAAMRPAVFLRVWKIGTCLAHLLVIAACLVDIFPHFVSVVETFGIFTGA